MSSNGVSVASAGDANDDGYADVVVGAFSNDEDGTNVGRAYVFLGGSTMDSIADETMTGAAAGDNFGISVASAADARRDTRPARECRAAPARVDSRVRSRAGRRDPVTARRRA